MQKQHHMKKWSEYCNRKWRNLNTDMGTQMLSSLEIDIKNNDDNWKFII